MQGVDGRSFGGALLTTAAKYRNSDHPAKTSIPHAVFLVLGI